MIENNKTSLLVKSQLPEFIRDEASYENFALFLQAYYEWTELTQSSNSSNNVVTTGNQGVTFGSKNLLKYKDVDTTPDGFLDYFYNDFLSYFPKDILADKQKVIKIAKELYQSKGTPASYKFLFRVLYNSDVEFFYTKDAVLRASAGKWYVAKSLRLSTQDTNFLHINNLRVFGETTKSIATVENVVVSGNKTEVFVSNIERLFQSGEFIRVVDIDNQDVYFLNGEQVFADGNGNYPVGSSTLRAKVVGQINQLQINPEFRGQFYSPGDPIVIHGGLNTPTGHGASAVVGLTTKGSIQRITVTNGGFGYNLPPNTTITITNAPGAVAHVASVENNPANTAVATFVPMDYIGIRSNTTIGANNFSFSNIITSNANTTLANAFSFVSFTTYPISSVVVDNGGSNINPASPPQVIAQQSYPSEDNANCVTNLASLGILAPIQIVNGGLGYRANDKIELIGGSGYGAFANVITVNDNGSIASVRYVYNSIPDNRIYPLGGMGYNYSVPIANVVSSNTSAYGASLVVPGTLGTGAIFGLQSDRVGAITTINVTDFGEDYISTPKVSLKVQDLIVSNVSTNLIINSGDLLYQGNTTNTASYFAIADSIELVSQNMNQLQSLYKMRVYDYTSKPVQELPIIINGSRLLLSNVTTYGDGTAQVSAQFLNGMNVSDGQYLDTSGQPSSFDILQSKDYNNYTYEITLEKEIEKYRTVLMELLHPSGMRAIGRYVLKSNNSYNFKTTNELSTIHNLSYYTGNTGSTGTIVTSFTNPSNNIIQFAGLSGANLLNFITTNSMIYLNSTNGDEVSSEVLSVNNSANSVVLKDNVWLTFANVAFITANANSNVINISSLTGAYDIMNNGNYSNTLHPLMDIVRTGDLILVANNTQRTVTGVNYGSNIIYVNSVLSNTSNSLLTVNRTFISSNIRIFTPV